MRSPSEMDIVVIDLTNKCHLSCSNCTRLVAHQPVKWDMDLPTFEKAVRSLEGWDGPGKVVGLIGGEPTLNKDFEAIAVRFKELWGGETNGPKGVPPIADFNAYANERLHDRSSGRGLWTSLGVRFNQHAETIHDVFDHWNTNTHEAGGRHQTGLVDRKEMCEALGISDEEWIKYRDNCWVQNTWSATITPKGSYFCEVAAHLDMLFNDGKRAWPIEPGWWKRKPEEFGEQLEICEMCSLCLPGPSQEDAKEKDIIGEGHRIRLQMAGSPAMKKGNYELYDPAKHREQRLVETKDSYVAGCRVGPDHASQKPQRVAAVVVAVGEKATEDLHHTAEGNAALVDQLIIVTDKKLRYLPEAANITVVQSDAWRKGDAAFNKGAMLNVGLAAITNPDWIILTDADVHLNKALKGYLKKVTLNPGVLYGTARIESKGGQHNEGVNAEPNGYFQLFNRKAKAIRDRWPQVMSEAFCSAGGVDSWFMQQWPAEKRVVDLALAVTHRSHGSALGDGWNGEATAPCWRQAGMVTPDGMIETEKLPEGPVMLKFTDTLNGKRAKWRTEADHAVPAEVLELTPQGIRFRGEDIGHHHVHVAYWRD